MTYNAIRPDSTEASESSYTSAGAGQVGQSLVYVVASWDDGDTWDQPVAVDEADAGHQFFPDIDALDGTLAVVWQDNRTDDDYDVQFPIGNTLDEDGNAISSGGSLSDPDDDIVNSFVATSGTGALGFADSVKVSDVGHQSAYEMFGNRDIPFHGDYNWVALALDEAGALFGYASWTDNRNVELGTDPRELEAQDGFDDGVDVLQCRDDLADSVEGLLDPDIPLARRDAPFGGDTCGNRGGLDQDIFGVSFTP